MPVQRYAPVRRRLLLNLVGMLLLVACATPRPNQPVHRVAYVTPAGAIATLVADGSQRSIVSPTDPAVPIADRIDRRYAWPTWSPDGRRVAFLAIDDYGASGAVFVANADGSDRVVLTELPDGYPVYLSWAPDGAAVAIVVGIGETLQVLLADASGRGAPRSVGAGQPLYTSWAPDSQALLIHAGRASGGSARQVALTRLGSGSQPETVAVVPGEFRAPAWSPAGSYQAVAGYDGRGAQALFLRFDDGTIYHFSDLDGPPAVVWSPAGDRLAWSSAVGFPYRYDGLSVATPDGHGRLRLVEEPLLAFFWSPDGAQIAYFTVDEAEAAVQLRVVPATGGVARTVASFQPTREYAQLLGYFDQYAQSVTIWSPDGRALLYAGWPPGADRSPPSGLYTVPADASAPAQLLVTGRIGFYAPAPPASRP